MPKRYFNDIDDGTPGEDDARYASAHYNAAGQQYQQYQQQQQRQQQQHHHQHQHPHPPTHPQQHHQHHSHAQYRQGQEYQPGSNSHHHQPIAAPGPSNANVNASASSASPIGSNYSHSPTRMYTSRPPAVSAASPPTPAQGPSSSAHVHPRLPHRPHASGCANESADEDEDASGSSNDSSSGSSRRHRSHPYEDDETFTVVVDDNMRETLFRDVYGRRLNTMQPLYQLPADEEEIKVSFSFHRPSKLLPLFMKSCTSDAYPIFPNNNSYACAQC